MSDSVTSTAGTDRDPPRLPDPEYRRGTIEKFVRDVVDDAGADGVVVNMSGGIDSSVTVTLAVEALGCESVTGLVLPAGPTPTADLNDAIELAEELVIDYRVLDLQPVVEQFLTELESDRGAGRSDSNSTAPATGDARRRTRGNLAARLRMTAAYFEANRSNLVVLCTGNRTELALGYFTKYGDGGVDALPLGDCYKTQVRDLAEVLDVPEHIVTKPPTAGLWEGQTDEDELGEPYPVVNAILEQLLDRDCDVGEAAATVGIDRARVASVADMISENAHKRSTPPTPASR